MASGADGALAVRASRVLLVPGPRSKGETALPWGLRTGVHTVSADVSLTRRLPDSLPPDRLRLTVHGIVDGERRVLATGLRAPNEAGSYRIRATFGVPPALTRIWFTFVGGSDAQGLAVELNRFMVTAGRARIPWFDGDTAPDRWYVYGWAGTPGASVSTRTARDPAASLADVPAELRAARLAEEVQRRIRQGLLDEATFLADHLRAKDDAELVAVLTCLLAEARDLADGPPSDITSAGADDWVSALGRDYDDRLIEAAGPVRSASAAVNGLVGRRLSRHFRKQGAKRAIPRLRAAMETDPDPRLGYALGWSLGQAEQPEAANAEIEAAARRDGDAPFDIAEAALEYCGRMHARREVGRFLASRLDTVRERAESTTDLEIGSPGQFPLFMYWGQGFEHAPALVRACRDAFVAHNPASDVHLLDDGLLSAYTDIPDHVRAINPRHRAAFSDALRLDLLVRHGGCWIDATCMTTGPIAAPAADLMGAGEFFAFRKTPTRPASWLLAGRPTSYVLRALRAAFFLWWEERDDLVDYYLLHHCFEMLCRLDPRFRTEWEAVPTALARPATKLQRVMLEPTPDDRLRNIVADSFVHKMTTGFDPLALTPAAPLAALLRGSLAGLA